MKKDLLICATFSLFLFSTAKAQTCEPEVPMQCAGKSVGQWVAEEKTRRCTPNPGIPGETITKCEVLVPWYNVHVGTYCRLDVLAIDPRAPNVEYSRSTAIYPNCPLNANGSTDYVLNGLTGTCQKFCPTPPDIALPDSPPPQSCPKPSSPGDGLGVGNPMLPALAEKVQIEEDLALKGPHPFSLVRIYRSGRVGATTDLFSGYGFPRNIISASSGSSSSSSGSLSNAGATLGNVSQFPESVPAPIGTGWSVNATGRIRVTPAVLNYYGDGININFVRLNWIYLSLPNGGYRAFKPLNENTWISESSTAPGVTDQSAYRAEYVTLSYANDGSGRPLYMYRPFGSDELLTFTITSADFSDPTKGKQGILTEIRNRNGWALRIEPDINAPADAPRPAYVVNHFNQRLVFDYTPEGQISAAREVSDSGQERSRVNYAYDSLTRLSTVTYADGSSKQFHYEDVRNPNWLTGESKNNIRYSYFSYDAKGRAFETQHGGGVDRFQITYPNEPHSYGYFSQTTVLDPLGTSRTYQYTNNSSQLGLTSSNTVPFHPDTPPIRSRQFNLNGQLVSEASFGSWSQALTYDNVRQLPTQVTEGGGSRRQTITWHPTFRLPTQIDETGGKRTTFAYDDKGNLLQKTVTATTGTPVNEVWAWTYNAQGLMATETDPRGATTTYIHNSWGQLTSQTNDLGHVTSYAYSPAGQVSQINEPTGLVRYLTYTPRGWLATSTLSAGGVNLATAYTYTVDGQVKSVALPNGHTITYFYDAALRNTGWSDNRGQSASYTLDPAGNAIEEQVKNNGGQLALQIRRTISALNRVQSETVGAGIVETYTQDANGRLASVTDATSKTTNYGRDALERINRVTDATNRAATITYNAQDAVTQVVDFQYVTTNYARDAQGNARSEATPDAGTTASTYDALGLPSRIVDALGRASDIARDALGRPTLITHSPASGTPATTPGGKTLTTQLRYDLTGSACNASGQANASKGRLCEVIDNTDGVTHATTQYRWDAFGRLVAQTQTLSSAIANHSEIRTTAFTYRTSGGGKGELATLTYPSGAVLTHQYNAAGRLSGMLWNGQPLLQAITWNALGQPLTWRWEFADASTTTRILATRLYNSAGQLTSSEFATFAPETTGRIGSVSQKLVRANGTGGWLTEDVPFNALYNSLGQLTSFTAVGTNPLFQWGHTYSYDSNANRTGGTITANGASMSFTSGVQSGTNRQSTAAGITVTTNAAGDITSLLGKALAYDSAGRLSEATAVPPCPSGSNCAGQQTTLSRFNGWGQRFLRDTPNTQTVFSYGTEGFNLLSETTRNLSTSALSTTEYIWLPTASGPMPIAAVIDGVHYAVHADHLNTPRRLTDASKAVKWQWPYSGFGEIAPQSTPAAGQAPLNYSLRYPGQIDDGNGLFYNWHRFYDPRVGRYTKADPIGLEGGWNRFGYVGGNPLGASDPNGLLVQALPAIPVLAVGCLLSQGCRDLFMPRDPARNPRSPDAPPPANPAPSKSPDAPAPDRDIWSPDRVPGQWSCKARADCNDNIPGNCPPEPKYKFAFGGGIANDLGTARNVAKANATSNLQCQPKHVSCKCTGPKGERYSGGC